jgi:hypothetical protein
LVNIREPSSVLRMRTAWTEKRLIPGDMLAVVVWNYQSINHQLDAGPLQKPKGTNKPAASVDQVGDGVGINFDRLPKAN